MNPLDQLADIRLPDEPSAWPPALGYYLVVALIVVLITLIAIYWQKRNQRLKIKKQSISALASINSLDKDSLKKIHHVLKTAANHYLPEQNVLNMQKYQWINLVKKLYEGSDKQAVCDSLEQLATWQYDERSDIASADIVKTAAQRWLERALPPQSSIVKASLSESAFDDAQQGAANV